MKYEEIDKSQLINTLQDIEAKVSDLWEWTSINTTQLIHLIWEYKSYAGYFEALRQNTAYGLEMNFDEIDRDAEWGTDTKAKTQKARAEAEKRFRSARSHFRDEILRMIKRIQDMIEKEQRGESPFLIG